MTLRRTVGSLRRPAYHISTPMNTNCRRHGVGWSKLTINAILPTEHVLRTLPLDSAEFLSSVLVSAHRAHHSRCSFQGRFFSAGWDLLCTKFEVSRFTRYEAINGSAKCRKWWFGVVRGHSRSRAMPPFDRAHIRLHTTLIQTMCLSFTVFEI